MSEEISLDILQDVANYFKVLSDMNRLHVLYSLKNGARNVSEIAATTQLGQPSVSKHLKILSQAKIVQRCAHGKQIYYKISDPTILPMCDLVCHGLYNNLQMELNKFNLEKTQK